MAVSEAELTRALLELIEALDRRVARIERVGEASIARDADALREKARKRLTEIAEGDVTAPLDPVRSRV
jgi:Asp-tRNA(Asn)/Glu-tRNA(Gln) amidotransferase A subunit family amidase